MAKGKSLLVDTSKCTACRGCQVACKQWHGLPGTKTKQLGTYQNPQDLSADTWKLVRFSEGIKENGKPYWYFFSEQCRHCIEPPCVDAIGGYDPEGATKDEATGAVIFTAKSKEAPFEEVKEACPYKIPSSGCQDEGPRQVHHVPRQDQGQQASGLCPELPDGSTYFRRSAGNPGHG